jgi:hypothetical protein
MKKICVVNFWEGAFDGDFFDYFFRVAFDGIEYTNNPDEADLCVTSVFGNVYTDPSKTIAYIGENVRPNFLLYNHSLSFDCDTYGGRNHCLPLWYSRLAWPGFEQKRRNDNSQNHGYDQLIDIKSLLEPRKLDMDSKNKFCTLIANNPESLRVTLYKALSEYKQVDGYGNMFMYSLKLSKFDILPKYKFCLCPENSIYNGYITEKLIDAYAAGAVPIYSGTKSVTKDFNPKSFLNYQDFMDTTAFTNYIQNLDTHEEFYRKMYEEPLLKKEPSLQPAIDFVRNIVK